MQWKGSLPGTSRVGSFTVRPASPGRDLILHTNIGRTEMPTFITYASYSHAGIKGLVSEPTDRTAAIKALIEKAGGKLIAAYMTTGSHDIVIIAEAPEGSDAVAAGMAASASGHLANVETVRAWSLPEFKAIAEKAKNVAVGFKPPGT